MTTKTTTLVRGVGFEARELREMTETQPFNAVARRIDQMIEDERHACERAETPKELRRAQGALKALRTVKQLPEILIHEMQGKAGR